MQLSSSKGSGAVGFDDWPRPRSRHNLISYHDKEWIYIGSGFGRQRETPWEKEKDGEFGRRCDKRGEISSVQSLVLLGAILAVLLGVLAGSRVPLQPTIRQAPSAGRAEACWTGKCWSQKRPRTLWRCATNDGEFVSLLVYCAFKMEFFTFCDSQTFQAPYSVYAIGAAQWSNEPWCHCLQFP